MERVKKSSIRIIMGIDFVDYPHSLNELDIKDLFQRREKLNKNMALK